MDFRAVSELEETNWAISIMPRTYNKTGRHAKANQRKQMYVYVDKWVELHSELNKLREIVENLQKLANSTKLDTKWLHLRNNAELGVQLNT